MQNNTLKWVLLYAAAGVGVYYYLTHNKRHYAEVVLKLGGAGGGLKALLSYDSGYVKAWAKAIKAGNNTFSYNGKTFHTKGGKAV